MNLSNTPYNLGSGKPSEPPEYYRPPDNEDRCEFGDLLIGAKFWLDGDEWLKVAPDMARHKVIGGIQYSVFKGNEIVEEICQSKP